MKSDNRYVGFFGRFPLPYARCSRALKIAAIAILLLGLPVGLGTARAATSDAHVFLVRGVLNIFSLGMDQIADRLQKQGITATVHNHLAWASIADEAAAEYKSGRIKTIILVGHSSGAISISMSPMAPGPASKRPRASAAIWKMSMSSQSPASPISRSTRTRSSSRK